MSEIPFVNQLGDALDAAIARPAPARRTRLPRLGRRRYLAVALAALAVVGGGAALADILHDPVEIGFGAVGCFEGTGTDGNVAVIADPTRSPIDLCAGALAASGLEPRDLIACSWHGHDVVVVARGDEGSCRARGLAPLPRAYALGRKRAARMQALAVKFERRAGCLTPREFATRLTAALRRGGFRGWRAVARGGPGPCGRVSVASGSSVIGGIGPAVDAAHRTVDVKGSPPLDLEMALEEPGSPGARLFDTTGERCFTATALERHVRRVFAPLETPISFTRRSLPEFVELMGARGDRYAEGCAVYEGAHFDYPDGRLEIVAELGQRDAPVGP
jgi:hypothetical protein